MARKDSPDPSEGGSRQQDPLVGRLRPDPAQPAKPALTLVGFLGDSDREGFRRLYFTRELDNYVEFRAEDVLDAGPIPPDQPPYLGDEATQLTVRRDAGLEFTRERAGRPLDEFDLDLQLSSARFKFTGPEFLSAETCVVNCRLTPTHFGPCPTEVGCETVVGPSCYPEGCERRARA
jgi:hypothetical protein